MSQESKYRVVLLDKNGCEITDRPAFNLREAKIKMVFLLSHQYASEAGTTHQALGTHKAEVRNEAGECVQDIFFSHPDMRDEIQVEVKWNNAAVKSTCPVTGECHKPWIGMYPFKAGTYAPILFDAIEDSDPEAAARISAINAATDPYSETEPVPVSMTVQINEKWLK